MNDRTIGLILKEQDYKDSSVILTVLSEEYGKISLLAQGARKMTSKNRGSILPYTKGEFFFDYKENRTMFKLKSARTVNMYRTLHENLNASLAVPVLAEVIDAILLEAADPQLSLECYQLFEQACEKLDEGRRADLVLAITLAHLLELQGIAPDVDDCVLCGSTNVTAISVKEGGFLCAACAAISSAPSQEPEKLRAFRLINKASLEHAEMLEGILGSTLEECRLLVEFLRMHAGLLVRSFALFQRMAEES